MSHDRSKRSLGFFLALPWCLAEVGCNGDAESLGLDESVELAEDANDRPNDLQSESEASGRGTSSPDDGVNAPNEEPGCTLNDEPLRISTTLVRENWTGIDVVELVIRNDDDVDADIMVSATVLSERQGNDNYRFDVGAIPAGSEAVFEVDVANLGISKEELEVDGIIWFGTHARFTDGDAERGPGPKLNFHPEGNRLLLYSDQVRRARPDRGHLSARAREYARIAREQHGAPQDFMFAPSFVGDPNADADWADDFEGLETPPPVQERTEAGFKICFRQTTNYVDSKIGEDYWDDDGPKAYSAIGQEYSVAGPGGQWSGNATNGCFTPSNYAPGLYLATFRSRGKKNGWDIEGQDLDNNIQEDWYYFWVTSESTITITLAYSDIQNSYMAVARALSVHGGNNANKDQVDLRVGSCGNNSRYFESQDYLRICKGSKAHHAKKFTIAHELGHMMQIKNSGHFEHQDGYQPNNGTNDCDPIGNGSSHGTTSIEYQGVAANEGYATFYAADAWNRHNQGDNCWVSIGQYETHPCRDGDQYKHPLKLMVTRCIEKPGLGNETDWARAFWELHTYPFPGNAFGHNNMLNWMADGIVEAGGLRDRAYQALSAVAGDWSVSGRWSNVSDEHGIDFPVGILF